MCTVIFLGVEGNSWIGCIQSEPICSLLAFVPFYNTFTTWRAVNVHVRQEISYTKNLFITQWLFVKSISKLAV